MKGDFIAISRLLFEGYLFLYLQEVQEPQKSFPTLLQYLEEGLKALREFLCSIRQLPFSEIPQEAYREALKLEKACSELIELLRYRGGTQA